ncbi:MAG TPA: cytochrome P450 [Candidatus Binataceae bacterium]|nr:cytochrome P450 [Candidatus Binataceae bacterium]
MIAISQEPFPLDCDPTLPGHPDPYPLYHRLRRDDPVHYSTLTKVWMLTRYSDALAYLRNPTFSRSAYLDLIRAQFGPDHPIVAFQSRELAFTDAPRHSWLRGIMAKAFSPQRIAAVRPHIEAAVDRALKRAAVQGAIEVVADFAYPIPADVISAMLGVPQEDWATLREWVEGIVVSRGLLRTPAMMEAGAHASQDFHDYLKRLMEDKRKSPGEDLLSALLSVRHEERAMEAEEIITMIETLFAAGHATTRNLIANGLIALLNHPDQHRKLRDHPALIAGAIEEVLRYDPPTQAPSPQVATVQSEIGGRVIRRGEMVSVLFGATNRDPARFEEPDRFDIERRDNEHLSFSHGIHYCLGAGLARLEAQVAVGAIVARFPALRLAAEQIEWTQAGRFRGPRALKLTL